MTIATVKIEQDDNYFWSAPQKLLMLAVALGWNVEVVSQDDQPATEKAVPVEFPAPSADRGNVSDVGALQLNLQLAMEGGRVLQQRCEQLKEEVGDLKRRLQNSIELTAAERQSGLDRVRAAEGLIKQLPSDHDGRNTWLANYGGR